MDRDEAGRKIRKAVEEGKVFAAESDGVDGLRSLVDDVFDALGIEYVFVSDLTDLSDFGADTQGRARMYISYRWGIDIGETDNLLAVLRMVHPHETARQSPLQ